MRFRNMTNTTGSQRCFRIANGLLHRSGIAVAIGFALCAVSTSWTVQAQNPPLDQSMESSRFAELIYGATMDDIRPNRGTIKRPDTELIPPGTAKPDSKSTAPDVTDGSDEFSMIEAEESDAKNDNDPNGNARRSLGMQLSEFPRNGFSLADNEAMGDWLTLSDVVASLYRSYPEIAAARQQQALANGQVIEAFGSFDTVLQAYSLNEPTGFYENYRHGLSVARRTWWGGYIGAGYKIGRGSFQPWYEERETEERGEFSVKASYQLLRGREIDPYRVAVFRASLERDAANPIFQQAILQVSREAAHLYWMWSAVGASVQAQRQLLDLAELRGRQYDIGVKAGKFSEIDQILNNQLIAERRAKLIETQQKFQALGFKLSLYLRTEDGTPMIPSQDWLPESFPVLQSPEVPLGEAISMAIARRPEPRLLQIELRQLSFDRRLARNDMLPTLHAISEVSQDVGRAASSSDDKGQLVMVLGLEGEVPIQRRKARGKLQQTNAKMAQVDQKLRLTRDKITAEVQEALNRLELSNDIAEQALISLRAAIETLTRYQFAFRSGKIDLIFLNLLEQKANETQIKLIEARQAWFLALSDLQFALGIDPLDQAMEVSTLPLSPPIDVSMITDNQQVDIDDEDDNGNDAAIDEADDAEADDN